MWVTSAVWLQVISQARCGIYPSKEHIHVEVWVTSAACTAAFIREIKGATPFSQLQTNNERQVWSTGNKELLVLYKALHMYISTIIFSLWTFMNFQSTSLLRTTQRAQFWKFKISTNVFYPELRWLTNVTFVWLTLYGLYMVQRIWQKVCHKTRP